MRKFGNALSPAQQARLRQALADHGEQALLSGSGLNATTLARAAAGLPILPGTGAAVSLALAALARST